MLWLIDSCQNKISTVCCDHQLQAQVMSSLRLHWICFLKFTTDPLQALVRLSDGGWWRGVCVKGLVFQYIPCIISLESPWYWVRNCYNLCYAQLIRYSLLNFNYCKTTCFTELILSQFSDPGKTHVGPWEQGWKDWAGLPRVHVITLWKRGCNFQYPVLLKTPKRTRWQTKRSKRMKVSAKKWHVFLTRMLERRNHQLPWFILFFKML